MKDDEFKFPPQRRKRSKAKKSRNPQTNVHASSPEEDDVGAILEKLEAHRNLLKSSNFLNEFLMSVRKACRESPLLQNTDDLEIVCYGLGNFSTSFDASYQLCLLLHLRDELPVSKVVLYDPVFSDCHVHALKELGMHVLEVNEEGKRKVMTPTIFYAPHCTKSLYNNILWANWSPSSLLQVIIIGNSFSEMGNSLPERLFKERFCCLHAVLPAACEIPIPNTFKFDTVFNNLSVHVFDESKLGALELTVWNKPEVLLYAQDDEIILSKK